MALWIYGARDLEPTRHPGLAPWPMNIAPLMGLQSFVLCITYDLRRQDTLPQVQQHTLGQLSSVKSFCGPRLGRSKGQSLYRVVGTQTKIGLVEVGDDGIE